ncbi:MAG: hypothetical protein ACFFD2_00755 [Promethearchaeota archaeon]
MLIRARLYNKKLLISVGLVIIFTMMMLPSIYLTSTLQSGYINDCSTPFTSPPITAQTEPFYKLHTPIAYNIEGQSITVYGDINSLNQETPIMSFKHDLLQVSSGSTYVIYTLSTADITPTEECLLNLNWEIYGKGSVASIIETRITVYIFYQNTTWLPIHTLSSPNDQIRYTYGWHEYTIPTPYTDYINGDEIKIKIELSQQLTQQRSWTQWLYACWFLLELQKDISLNPLNAIEINVTTEGFECSGNISAFHQEDGNYYILSRTDPPVGEPQLVQFIVTYDLGYYKTEPLRGLRFSHLDWIRFVGVDAFTYNGEISIVGESSDMWLCYIRQMRSDPVIPGEKHATFPITSDWNRDGKIRIRYDIEYMVEMSEMISIEIDLASIQIVRGPEPIIVFTMLNSTLYAQENLWLNITCLDGKALITEIRLSPWNDLIGTASGSYLYSQYVNFAGDIPLSITIKDAEDEFYVIPFGEITVLPRPLSVALYLSEDPFLQEFIIQLYIKDIFSNEPLGFYPFSKTILQNGSWFRQESHQTTLSGTFEIRESVVDYLDWNYTVIIETQETSTHEATSALASILLSQCPPYLYVNNISYNAPLKSNNQVILNYTVICQSELDTLLLYKNGSIFLNLPTELGSHTYTFQDTGGFWKYYLYANNSRGFQGYSLPFILNISPLETYIQLDSTINLQDNSIVLEIELFDELNRSCPNVPLQVSIYDFGETFYYQEIVTGMDGVYILVHFDQFIDHSFTVIITSESTPIYYGAFLSAGELFYEGYPLHTIIGLGIVVGCVSIVLFIIKRRIRVQ